MNIYYIIVADENGEVVTHVSSYDYFKAYKLFRKCIEKYEDKYIVLNLNDEIDGKVTYKKTIESYIGG